VTIVHKSYGPSNAVQPPANWRVLRTLPAPPLAIDSLTYRCDGRRWPSGMDIASGTDMPPCWCQAGSRLVLGWADGCCAVLGTTDDPCDLDVVSVVGAAAIAAARHAAAATASRSAA
jgi:hypothetical protein